MLPFVQQNPYQPGSAAPPSQQVPGTSVDLQQLQNLLQIQSQMGIVNPQSNPFNGNRPPGPMNFPNFNTGQMGNPILGSAPQGQPNGGFIPQNFMQNLGGQLGNSGNGNPGQFFGANPMNMVRNLNPGPPNFQNGQFGWQNQLQNMNQLGNLAMFNPSQIVALAQLMGCANQVAQSMVPQNGFYGSNPNPPQIGGLQPNGVMQQPSFGQQLPNASQQMQNTSLTPSNPMPPRPQSNQAPTWQANFGQQLPIASQQMQNVPLTASNPMSPSPQNNQAPSWQGNPGTNHGMHMSNPNHQNKNFVKNNQRGASNGRFQKSQNPHHDRNMQQNFSKENGGKGIENSGPNKFENQSKGGKRRSLAALYTEKEIRQWCEERKKNYPSKHNVQKKLEDKQANAAAVAEEAERRRQQLKEVLAKQVELGFEVPEIPSHYGLDSEEQFQGRDRNKRQFNNGRFDKRRGRFNQNNRFDRRRGAEGNDSSFGRNERFPKRQRAEGNGDSSKSPINVKEPTLLEKLLSNDLKRDQNRLLHAFRFMATNSFFKDLPEKPLTFPKVIVKENGSEGEEKPCGSKGELASIAEDIDASDESDIVKGKGVSQQEEGEITD